jgi:hypothetical protein
MEGFGSARVGNTQMEAPTRPDVAPASVPPTRHARQPYTLSKRMDGVVSTCGRRPPHAIQFSQGVRPSHSGTFRPACLEWQLRPIRDGVRLGLPDFPQQLCAQSQRTNRFRWPPTGGSHPQCPSWVTNDKTHSEYKESACPSDSRHSSGRRFPPLRARRRHGAIRSICRNQE